ncbi:branched-chain amino acid ABC transporter permease [Bradyrhizobium mercantei]|uniref:branched-chain amino acid ABC transporter permease n=1 Tax=Bradyrhizobium mercantei TaxID=1904807 RepID=UPI000975CDCB|nr:branched-chain amino acid ABC transporter permease [Bradyrhizobium mercantei]
MMPQSSMIDLLSATRKLPASWWPNELTPGVAAALATAFLPLMLNDYQLQVMWVAFYLAVLAISWNLVAGYGGMFSLAQHALATIGGYSSAAAVLALGLPVWWGVVCGGLAAALLGYLLGHATLHLRSLYFAIATWVFAEVARQLITINYEITRGAMGLQVPYLFSTLDPIAYFYLFLGLLLVAFGASAILLRTKLGYRIQAVRDDEELAIANGVNAARAKRTIFAMSAGMAGMAGAMYGHAVGLLAPSQADFSQMSLIIIAAVLGGYRTLWGPIIGAILIQAVAEMLRFSQEGRLVIFAALLIVVFRLYPQGVMGALKILATLLRRRRQAEGKTQ